ncbi:glycosyltransferase, family 2 [Campylobacter sp. RM5004]|uniref:glycosyltransferase family 2 protein n=1 Tax=Campylobacter sp. RM5004 TaxID=1660078 RepID=UPI001EFAB905|nr:glycosyltransferase family 2 protein [Campylobacter sp. RM5004]ULO02440.1 glycosyltransferase, family 2 [Campylobacter sp. RM5004]
MPLISIILPTYNVEKYIARALESCINQTLKDIEIIVVDDKGQDRSIDIAKEYANIDDRIKIIDNITNQGTYEARNIGVRNANSELIMFLDPDDELELNACEIVNSIAGGGQSCIDMICFNAIYIQENKIIQVKTFNDECFVNSNFHKFIYGIDSFWNLCFKCVKKDLYLKSITFIDITSKINMAEDALVFYFILNCSKNIISVSTYLYKYYINSNSIMNTGNLKKIKANISTEKYVINLIGRNKSKDTKKIKRILLYRLKKSLVYKLYKYRTTKYPRIKPLFRLILSINKKYFKIIGFLNNFKI